MKNKSFFILFTLSSLISMFTTTVMIGYFDYVSYGQYNLYLTYLGILALLSFGYQDGVLLNHRQKDMSVNHRVLKLELLVMIIIQLAVFIVTLAVAIYLQLELVWIYAILAMFPNIIITILKNIYQATNKLITMTMIDLMLKVMTLIGLVFVMMFSLDLNVYLILDILIKYIIMIVFTIYFVVTTSKYKHVKQESKYSFEVIKSNFRIGFLVMIGNWIVVVLYSMDKLFLKTNATDLGLYSVAMACISIFITLLVPIRTLFLTSVNINITSIEIKRIVKMLNIVGIVLAIGYNFIGLPIILRFNILTDYQDALIVLGILCALLPVILSVQIILSNLLILKFNRMYAVINLFLLIITFIIFTITTTVGGTDINSIIVGLFAMYFVQYMVYIFVLHRNVTVLNEFLFVVVWLATYTLSSRFGVFYDSAFVMVYFVYIIYNLNFIKSFFIKEVE
jgi:O-antigen/teichoic acid export membrane protein